MDHIQKLFLHIGTTYDLDTTDRIKYTYTTWILTVLSIFSFANVYASNPLTCWIPNQFAYSWGQYAADYCFVEGSYFVSNNLSNLPDEDSKKETKILYYQWIPFILAFHAVVTYIPRLLWKLIQQHQDISIPSITAIARQNAKGFLGNNLKRKPYQVSSEDAFDKWRLGRLLAVTLLGTKFLSLAILVSELFVLDWLLSGSPFSFYGISFLYNFSNGIVWQQTGIFPRTTFCDFQVREMAQVHTWTVQCVLKQNMYNEKIFVFLWFWFAFLIIISLINFLKWVVWTTNSNQLSFLKEVVKSIDSDFSHKQIVNFQFSTLRTDGVSVLRLIEANSTIYEVAEFIEPLWKSNKKAGLM